MKQATIEKILLNIEKHVDQMMKAFGKLNESEMKAIGNFVKLSEKIIETNNQLEMTKKEWNARRWITAEEGKTRIESLNISKEINRERIFGKRLLEQEHRDNVQSNIKLRESFKQMDVTMGRVTRMFGGVNPLQVAGMGVGAGVGITRARMQHSSLTEALSGVQAEIAKDMFTPRSFTSEGKQDDELRKSRLRSLEKDMDNLKETKAFRVMESNPVLIAMSKQLEKVGNFMAKHSTGVIISVVSLGLLIGLFKAALSVSPMLQKMLELMTMTFGLVLRPFGDFFGFILRPIAMAFLASVIPFFKEMYPRMMEWGNEIGNSLVPFVKMILDTVGSIWSFLDQNRGFVEYAPWVVIGALTAALAKPMVGFNRGGAQKTLDSPRFSKEAIKATGQRIATGTAAKSIPIVGSVLTALQLGSIPFSHGMLGNDEAQYADFHDSVFGLGGILAEPSSQGRYSQWGQGNASGDKTIITYNQHIERVEKDVDLNELTPHLNEQTHKEFKARK